MKTQKTIIHTKSLISLSLFQLLLKKDYENISVKEICHRAGVSRMSFYRYYTKKEDIFIDFCDQRFEEFYNDFLNQQTLSLDEFLFDAFAFFYKYNRELLILKKAGKEQLLTKQFNGYAKYLISHNNSRIIQEQKTNPCIGPFFAGGIFNVLMTWLDQGMEQTPEEIFAYLRQISTIWKQSL